MSDDRVALSRLPGREPPPVPDRPADTGRFGRLRDGIGVLRVGAWISKLPALVLGAYAAGAAIGIPSGDVCYSVVFCSLHLALGYTANDLADWRSDIEAGNPRSSHRYGRRYLTTVVLALAVANVLWLLGGAVKGGAWQALFGLLTVALGFIYSFPPRLKGRGLAGVVFSAYTQWVSPMVFLLLGPHVVVRDTGGVLVIASVLIWLAGMGCHGALRHQIRDLAYDRAFTRTYAVDRGKERTRRALTLCRVGVFLAAASIALWTPRLAGVESALGLATFSIYHLFYYKRLERG